MTHEEADSLLTRTGMVAERALAGTGLLTTVRSRLDRSDWTLSPGEFVAVSAGCGLFAASIGAVAGSPIATLLFGGLAGLAPYALVTRSVNRRQRRFDDQFPDVLDLVAASLESGASVAAALELVVAEADDPTASEFARVLAATRLGTPLVEALQALAERLGSRDLTWTVQAIVVQNRTGGRLAEVLRVVAGFMRARQEVRQEVRTLTAEGKLSAYVLTALPIALLGFISLVRPAYVEPMYHSAVGVALLIVGAVSIVFSYAVMSRIVKIEV
jgi:tight adherence protein B